MTFRPRLVPCPNGCTTFFGEERDGARVEYATSPDCPLCGGRGEVIEIERDGISWIYQKQNAVNLEPKGEAKMGEKIQLGAKVKDSITGFVGKVTARCEYLNGTLRIMVEGIDGSGRPVESWIDETRAEVQG